MRRTRAPGLLIILAATAAGCAQDPPEPAAAPAPVPATPERLESDDPRAGLNNTRPDSADDIKPEPGTPQP